MAHVLSLSIGAREVGRRNGITLAIRRAHGYAATATTSQPAVTAAANGPIPLSATGPGWLAPGSDPSVLPGPVLIADGGGNRVLIIDSSGRTLWEFPAPPT